MKHLAYLTVATLLLAVCVSPALAAGGKKKKKDNVGSDVAGTVVSVAKGEGDNANTTLTLKVQGGKKKAQATEQKFELKDVKLEALVTTKKAFGLQGATVDDLKEGEHVLVQFKEGKPDQVGKVLLVSAGKKKAK